jgi:hypothetical protein
MKSFEKQLAETRANLERLEKLFAEHPDLFYCANLIEVTPKRNRVYIHAMKDRERDWKGLALKYRSANWQRQSSASDYSYYDYDGVFEGLEISILQAEPKAKSQPLFTEDVVRHLDGDPTNNEAGNLRIVKASVA